MDRYPTSLIEFQSRFGTEEACAAYLIEQRWPDGFVCPVCGSIRAWRRKTLAHTFECADCGRQTSVRAGTILHDSKLVLTTWFVAAFLIATHTNGLSARQAATHARSRLVPDGVDAGRQAAPGDG